jgi:thioredoxin reductase
VELPQVYLHASRQGLKTLLLTKDIGGQALLTNDIENYPAFEHIGGFELMSKDPYRSPLVSIRVGLQSI